MNIKIGKQYINKTWRFLVPVLRGHGDPFVNRFNMLFKLSVGIHDNLLSGSELSNGRNIYVLLDKKHKERNFKEFMNFLECQEYFKGGYCPDADIMNSRKYMIIIEVPKEFNNAYDKFLQSKYSEMYTPDEVKMFFAGDVKVAERGILSKDVATLETFMDKISKEFGAITNPQDFAEVEWELPLKKKEEIFHYDEGGIFFREDQDKVWKE